MVAYDHRQVCTNDKEVVVGGQYQYYEDGYIADVTVLEEKHTDDGIGFRLRVDKPLRWPGKEGDEFSCWGAHKVGAYSGIWKLYSPDTYVTLPARNPAP